MGKKLFISVIFIGLLGLYYTGFLGAHLILTETNFKQLPHWKDDDKRPALLAFQRSCGEILKRKDSKSAPWQRVCLAANQLNSPDAMTAERFFETWFQPYRVSNNFNAKGLFTGYYLPLIHGSLKRDKRYAYPVYGVPKDLVKVNLYLFHLQASQKIIIGQLKNNTLIPYPDRAAINQGAIDKHAPSLVWCDNPVDVFFAQIQGSTLVELPDHQHMTLGYAMTNGQPYTAIGKVLIENKVLTKETVSMQTIREWLLQHPNEMNSVLEKNASYVFFHKLKEADPLGSEHVPLTPQRSLAVDTHYIPLGAPVWLDTETPRMNRLLVAQDTGGAIKGVVRGDVYWGAGEEAASIAGTMKSKGKYWVFLPKN